MKDPFLWFTLLSAMRARVYPASNHHKNVREELAFFLQVLSAMCTGIVTYLVN